MLAVDQALDPPVVVMRLVQVAQWLAGGGQVGELASLLAVADAPVVSRFIRHPHRDESSVVVLPWPAFEPSSAGERRERGARCPPRTPPCPVRRYRPAASHPGPPRPPGERKSTRLNSSHVAISYAVFCLKKKT